MHQLQSDPFRNRGAVEQDSPEQEGNLDFRGQMGHRNKGPIIDSHDTDFPEPGENPEHTGEAIMAEQVLNKAQDVQHEDESEQDANEVDQDPGERQNENQGDEKDDPLAA